MSLWRQSGEEKVIVGATGKPVNCAECPCEGGIQTDCCPTPINRRLLGTITDKTGTCDCLPDSIELVYDDDSMTWTVLEPLDCDPAWPEVRYDLFCMGETFSFTDPCATLITEVSFSCDPFELVLDVTISGAICVPSPCLGGYRITFTVAP